MPVMKFTKTAIDKLTYEEGQPQYFHDTDLPGFGVYVGKKGKSFFAQSAINSKTVRVKIGRYGLFTVDEARKEAKSHLVQMSKGINPNKERKAEQTKVITVEEVYKSYIKTKKLKPRTLEGYEGAIEYYLKDWKNKSLKDISREDVRKKHSYIGKHNGPAVANKAMRFLRALFYYADATYDLKIENPVRYLSIVRGWYPEKRRQNYIKSSQLSAWYKAVIAQTNINYRDLFLLILFTGLRRNEALTLRWEHVDFEEKIFTVQETKNGETITLPMSDVVFELLQQRSGVSGFSPYVFPGSGNE